MIDPVGARVRADEAPRTTDDRPWESIDEKSHRGGDFLLAPRRAHIVVKNKNRHADALLSIRQNVEKRNFLKIVFHRAPCGKCGKPISVARNNHRIFRHFEEFSTFSTTRVVENRFLTLIVHVAQLFQKTEINGAFWMLFFRNKYYLMPSKAGDFPLL